MGTILLLENDPVFGAVLEDRLHVAGHEVELLRDRESAVASAAASPRDLLIIEIDSGNRGLEVVAALRQGAETRTLPILVLSESVDSADRAEVLARVGKGTGVRVFDLMKELPWAPQKIRLAVAWLVEQDVLGVPAGASAHAYPTTSEVVPLRP